MSTILVLGGSYLQSNLISTGVYLGHKVYFLDRDLFCYARRVEGAVFSNIDLIDEEAILSFAKEIQPDAIIPPANELGNQVAARLAQKLGLLYNSAEVVHTTIDKHSSRSKLGSAVRCPKSMIFDGDLNHLIEELDFPLIVKPSNSSASRGVSCVFNEQELTGAINNARAYLGKGGVVLVEEYIVGTQFSIESVTSGSVHHIAAITREEMSAPPTFIERSDFMSPEIYQNCLDLFSPFVNDLLNGLGIKVGPCHIEVILRNNELYLVEVGSRSGGWRDYLMQHAGSVDYNRLIINSYLGKAIGTDEIVPPKKNAMAGILMYPSDLQVYLEAKKDGVLVGEYFNGKGPSIKPKSLIDAFGYFYVASNAELEKYNLNQPVEKGRINHSGW